MSKPTANDFILLFEKLLAFFGPGAFEAIDNGFLYSGPQHSILKELFGYSKASLTSAEKKKTNKAVAERATQRTHTFRLEDTRPGKILEASSLYEYFITAYHPDRNAGRIEADKAWSYLSKKFIQALSGNVMTAVCGADRGRVFCVVELPELVINSNIDTVNGVPWQKIRDLYFSDPAHGPYKAFRVICLSELRGALRRAKTEMSREAIEDYYYRRSFYHIERRLTLAATGKAIPAAYQKLSRAKRRADFAAFKAAITAHKTPSASATTPVSAPPAAHLGLHP